MDPLDLRVFQVRLALLDQSDRPVQPVPKDRLVHRGLRVFKDQLVLRAPRVSQVRLAPPALLDPLDLPVS